MKMDLEAQIVDWGKKQKSDARGWYTKDGGHYQCINTNRYIRGQITKQSQQIQLRQECEGVDVQILGVVAKHHKAGTVFRRNFYESVCAFTNVNYANIVESPITASSNQNNTLATWKGVVNYNGCIDFHPCNTKGIIHAPRKNVRTACKELGVPCPDRFDLRCYIQKCEDLIKTDKESKIVNPIRNPFSLVTSAYKYHKGNSPEDWVNQRTVDENGMWRPNQGMDNLQNETLSHALEISDLQIGLELAYRIMGNDLVDMTLLHKMSHNNTNIMSSRYEDCLKDFGGAMQKELEFLNFYNQNVTNDAKLKINSIGFWVMNEKNVEAQKQRQHISQIEDSDQSDLDEALKNHPRFDQLTYMAEILGYKVQT
eukprot:TRINITY_DN3898_c0_g1_i5.p1 TRINITY_DN3898_c0_g1~~TRINITY_DN3898_c0_g1_i5.p1  ORF type:complete len:369 (-),score=49.58 TRINITY_DN3898_c0_g1_i5:645-1751(-)